ncbi:MAG: hypothetical protein ACR2JB_13185 [Bryobacteraceae bacterium]
MSASCGRRKLGPAAHCGLRHRFETANLGSTGDAIQLAVAFDWNGKNFSEFRLFSRAFLKPLDPVRGLIPLPNKTAYRARQGIELAKVIEHRSTDTVLGESFQQALTLGLVAIYGLNETDNDANTNPSSSTRLNAACVHATGEKLHLREMQEGCC